jgi:hypothetical protein
MTELQLITALSNGGAFALLAYVILWVMKENSKREERLMTVIEKYTEKMQIMGANIKDVGSTLELIERRIPANMGRKREHDRYEEVEANAL